MAGVTITEAARRFRDGSLSPDALTDDYLVRIERENPSLNAYWEIFASEAREDAARAAREMKEGRDRGLLHGVPIALKDLFDVDGKITTAGAHKGFHPGPAVGNAEVVEHLRSCGAVILGKTALHEWALGASTNNAHFGPTRNPHDPACIPGGSSGGSAAAVAADLCIAALGSDTGGSIRIPATLCGVVGLKPTYGLVSTKGVVPLSRSLDHVGVLAKTPEDAFVVLETISTWRRAAVPALRVLLPKTYFFEAVDPEIERLVRAAATRIAPLEAVDVQDVEAVWDANTVILLSDAAAFHEQRLREHPEWFGPGMVDRFRKGLDFRAVDYARARDTQREWIAFLNGLLGDHSVLCVPGTPVPATPIGEIEGAALAGVMTRFTAPFNLAGVPVLSVPIGKVGHLPVGMQIVAGPHRESVLYEAARRMGI